MYCKYCGSEIDDDAEFCPDCGRSQACRRPSGQASHQKGGRYQQRKKKRHMWPVFLLILIVVVSIVVLFVVMHKDPVKTAIQTVQDGYFGEYTDLPVKTIMDQAFGKKFTSSEWNGYRSDSDVIYVNASYFNKERRNEGVFVEFIMLNKDQFKVSSVSVPDMDAEDSMDRVFLINMMYVAALARSDDYDVQNEDDLIRLMQDQEFIARFEHVSLSSACYGASADYHGNRADMGSAYGAAQIDITVKDLLEFMGFFCNITEEAIAKETEEPDVSIETTTETVPETQPIPEETQSSKPPINQEPVVKQPAIDPHEAAEAISQVLRGARDCRLNVPESTVNIYSIYKLGDYFCDPPMYPEVYRTADLDHDGSKEAIVTMNIGGEIHAYIILRYEDGTVYGFFYHLEKEQIGSDGRVIRYTADGNILCETFAFDHGNLYNDSYIVEDNAEFMWDWTDAAEHYFEFADPMEGDDFESYEPVQPQNTSDFSNNPAAAKQLQEVIYGAAPLILSYSGESIYLCDITKVVDYADENGVLVPVDFTVVDMDMDQTPEMIMTVQGNQVNPWRLILRYQDGAVYGYGFPFRGLACISIDGRAEGSSGADNTDFFRLIFDKTKISSDPICGQSADEIWADWIDVTWYEFNNQNVTAFLQ